MVMPNTTALRSTAVSGVQSIVRKTTVSANQTASATPRLSTTPRRCASTMYTAENTETAALMATLPTALAAMKLGGCSMARMK